MNLGFIQLKVSLTVSGKREVKLNPPSLEAEEVIIIKAPNGAPELQLQEQVMKSQ